MRRCCRLWWCFVSPCGATWLRLVAPLDGEHVVSDQIQIKAIVVSDSTAASSLKDGWIELPGGAPSQEFPVCVGLDGEATCFKDYGPVGSRAAGVLSAFATIATRRRFHEVRVWSTDEDDTSAVSRFSAETVSECAQRRAATKERRLFDVFPFFGGYERDVLELRLRELRGDVDVFVPIEANVTHSGLPKALDWRDNGATQARFRGFDVRGFVASENLRAENGTTPLAREEAQRDAAREALVVAGAAPEDLVLLADADEVANSRTLRDVLECARGLDDVRSLLPLVLQMDWYVYDLRWRASRPWGLFAREGPVLVTAAMLGISSTSSANAKELATAWRRQLRGDRQLRDGPGVRVADGAGWHLSSFGGETAVAEKLRSYIGVSEYGDEFYQDPERLSRLRSAGLAYFELAGYTPGSRLFHCQFPLERELPSYVPSRFLPTEECPSVEEEDDLSQDAAAARFKAVQAGHVILGGWGPSKRLFEPTLRCVEDEDAFWTDLRRQCAASRLTDSACRNALPTLRDQCRGQTTVTSSVDFQETTEVPIVVDGDTHYVALHAADNATDVAEAACLRYGIPQGSQCAALRDALRVAQPLQAWLPPPDSSSRVI